MKQQFGSIDVLEYSPADHTLPAVSIFDMTHDDIRAAVDFNVHGGLATVQAVLPEMLARQEGTILFTTGASSVYPRLGNKLFASFAIAGAGLRAYAYALHAALAPSGVQVGHVSIGAWIGQQSGATLAAIAPLYWELHTKRNQVEKLFMLEEANGPQSGAEAAE